MKQKSLCRLTWLGHSAFCLETPSGKKILFDPWLDNPKAPKTAKEISAVDFILISHGHSDHVGNTIEIANRTGAKVIAMYEVTLYLQRMGLTDVRSMNKGGTFASEGISFTMVDAKHSADIDTGGDIIPGGEAAGFVVRLEDGQTVYHAGDTNVFLDMQLIEQLYKPSVALLPIGGIFTMGPREAALACTFLRPKIIIGMHYGTFPLLTGTPAQLREFLPLDLRDRVHELEPGMPVDL